MSRLLTALKRLDESEGGQSALSSPVVALPRSVEFKPAVSLETDDAATSLAGESTKDNLPTTQTTIKPPSTGGWPSADAPQTLNFAARSSDAASTSETYEPRRVRSASPGRRATDQYCVAPEYVALCDAILERVSKSRPMAILVVPAASQVDATTVAAELSLSMAQALDLPVVAIDADMDGSATETETAVATAGLSDVLIDRVDWRSVLAPARDDRVRLLAAGRPITTAESLAPAIARLVPIVTEMKTRYRCLIVHGGVPTNPLTGALVQACDLVYLVVRLGLTTRRAARAAKRCLQRGGALVHGSILLTGP